MNLRIYHYWWLLTFITHGSSITLLQVLQIYPELSTLQSYINASSNATSLLANANNFTFLASNNNAISDFLTHNPTAVTGDLLEATIQYSLLHGGYPTLSITNTPQFVASNLVNSSYANVTGGQAVELVLGSDGPQVVTGNKSISTSTTTEIVCTGGIIHILNEVLSVPISAVLEITAANLEYFISILNIGGYLSTTNVPYVNAILEVPDVTYFIPNSAEALANATSLSKNSSATELQALFQYHIVPDFVGYSSLLTDGMSLKTAQGDNVTITIQDGNTYINAAKVIDTDYIVANGVVHVIDSLLNRFDTSPPPKPTTSAAATSNPTPTTTPASTAISSAIANPTHKSSSLSHGAIAGIAVGVTLAGLLILAALIWFLLRSRRQKREAAAWNDQMRTVPYDSTGTYADRSHAEKREDLGLRLQTTGMHDVGSGHMENKDARNPAPIIPPRSPSRVYHANEF